MPQGTVLLLGDAVRLAYQDRVASILGEDGLRCTRPGASTGDSRDLARQVDRLIDEHQPDLACFGCGRVARESVLAGGADAPALAGYEADLLHIAEALRRFCGRQVVFVTAPPVDAEGYVRAGGEGGADGARELAHAIEAGNHVAIGLMGELNIGVADVHAELARHGEGAYGDDGVALSPAGVELAARVVAHAVLGVV